MAEWVERETEVERGSGSEAVDAGTLKLSESRGVVWEAGWLRVQVVAGVAEIGVGVWP